MVLNFLDSSQPDCLNIISLGNMEDELLISEDMGDEFNNDFETPSEIGSKCDKIDSNEDINEEITNNSPPISSLELVVVDEVNCEFDQSTFKQSTAMNSSRARQKSASRTSQHSDHNGHRKPFPNARRNDRTLNRGNGNFLTKNHSDRRLFGNTGGSNTRQHSESLFESNRKYSSLDYYSHSSSQRRSDHPSRTLLNDRYGSLCNLPINQSYDYSTAQDIDFRYFNNGVVNPIRSNSYGDHQLPSKSYNSATSYSHARSSGSYLHDDDHHNSYTNRSSSSFHPTDHLYHRAISDRGVGKDLAVQGYDKPPVSSSAYHHSYSSTYDRSYHDNRHENYPHVHTPSHSGFKPLINPEELRRELNKRRYESDNKASSVNSPKPQSIRSPKSLTDKPRSKPTTPTARRNGKTSQRSTPRKSTGRNVSSNEAKSTRAHKPRTPLISPIRVKEAPLIDIKSERRSPSPEPPCERIESPSSCSESLIIVKDNRRRQSIDKATTVSKSSNQLLSGGIKQEPTNKISEETFKQAEKMGVDVTYLLEYKANEAEIQRRREEITRMKAEGRRQRLLLHQNHDATADTNRPVPVNNNNTKSSSSGSTLQQPVDKTNKSTDNQVQPRSSNSAAFRSPKSPIRRILKSPLPPPAATLDSPYPSPTKKRRVIHSLAMDSASVVQNLSRNITNIEAAEQLRVSLSKPRSRQPSEPNEPRSHLVEVSHLKPFSGLKELQSLVRYYFSSATVQKVSSDTRTALLEFVDEEEATDFVRRFNGFKLRESIIKVALI